MSVAKVCPSCGNEALPGAVICPRDGTRLEEDFEPTALRDPLLGTNVGEYEIVRRLGEGGMGLVYEGLQPVIGKRVAIKVLLPEIARDPEWSSRFVSEARAVNAIRHRGIVDVFSFNALADGRQCLVMELLEGEALDHLINRRGRLSASEALPLLEDVFEALDAAHGAGVIHRDLKPSNLFVVRPPRGESYVKVLDFGLAKQGLPDATTAQTRVSRVVGTPHYMAPEQGRGEAVSPRTDLYAMGVVMFEMLAGRLPFDGPSPMAVLAQHLESEPPQLSRVVPGVPPALDDLVGRLLKKTPEERPGSAASVRKELSKLRRRLEPRSTRVTERQIELAPEALSGDEAGVAGLRAAAPARRVQRSGPAADTQRMKNRRDGEKTVLVDRPARPGWLRPIAAGAAVLVTALVLVVAARTWTPTAGLPEGNGRREDPPAPPVAATRLEPTPRVPQPDDARAEAAVESGGRREPETSSRPVAVVPRRDPIRVDARAHASGQLEPSAESAERKPVRPAPRAPSVAELTARCERLEQQVRSTKTPPSRAALVLLSQARADAAGASSPEDLFAVEAFLDDWESRFLAIH